MSIEPDERSIRSLLEFWFAEETRRRWYDSTPAFDMLCRERFGDLSARAAAGDLHDWEKSAEGALALCLLLDQIPRNIHRGSPKAFETDRKAVDVASRAIENGFDHVLDEERRKFLYIPFMHSERLADQERGIALYEAAGDADSLKFAEEHADLIRRFGRFPHRNAILGRESTAEEKAFLADGAKTYGQSAADED